MKETRQADPAGGDRVADRGMDLAIAAWRGKPDDGGALAGVRASMLASHANAIQAEAGGETGREPLRELARSVCNLLDRVREGRVDPNAAVVDAVAGAAGLLADPTASANDAAVGDLAERLDAYASGLTDLEFEDSRGPGEPASNEPPLLTVRHDGVRVTPGSFDTAPGAGDQADELPVLVDAWQAVAVQLRGHLRSVRAIDQRTDAKLPRLGDELQAAVDTVERLNRMLAAYARRASG